MTDSMNEISALFARRHIAPRSSDLGTGAAFPHDIWRQLGEAGLFGIGIGEAYGGSGGGYAALAEAGETLAQNGGNLGLPFSWLYQQLVARFFLTGFGNEEQRQRYLPPMAGGNLTASFAVSEPGHGANPKLLATTASKDGASYTLDGGKTYLTNGPIAGLFIVVAVTEDTPPRRQFTAFLVPRETEGLAVAEPMALPFLKPSLHGGIRLSNCRLPETAILGEPGSAYRKLVIPFGEVEDLVMPALAAGGMARQMELLIAALHGREAQIDAMLHGELGALAATLAAFRILSREGVKRLDEGEIPSPALPVAGAELAALFGADLEGIITRGTLDPPAEYRDLTADLTAMAAIKRRVLRSKREKIGRALLEGT